MTPLEEAKWRVQISGALLDLTREVKELAAIVHKIAEKLTAEQSQDTSPE